MTDKLDALLPCPFCGGEANSYSYRGKYATVHCNSTHAHCAVRPEHNTMLDEAVAIAQWNTRPTSINWESPELREAVADGIAREVPMDMQDAYSAADGAIAAFKSFGRGEVNE